ncbi:F-box protein At4g22390-like [Coffea arabica]|uniref:F-box protein At4g22390-like n=1 Tax=Coffea arabica TaxID=13443 RepID=A0A6P6UIC0_COFAR|nr:F-box protein At4g22390-like [Coffea arabica]
MGSRIEGSRNHLSLKDWRVNYGGAFVNGKHHWAAKSRRKRGLYPANKIVSFDLVDETYGDIELPENYTVMTGSMKWSIRVLGEGYLALLWHHVQEHVNLWIMTDYGVGQSWTKMLMIPYPEDDLKCQFSRSAICAMQPVFLSINGKLLLKLGSRLVLYNLEDDSYEDCTISYNSPHVGDDLRVDIYDESLVLPDANDGQIS